MHVIHIDRMDLYPPVLRHMIQIIDRTTHGISMTSVINRPFAQVNRLLHSEIGSVVGVQYSVSVG